MDVLVFYVPKENTHEVLRALFDVGAGSVGDYSECAFITAGTGQFRPLRGAHPTVGCLNQLERVEENRVELTFDRKIRTRVLAALRGAHPYEEPAFHVIENPVPHETQKLDTDANQVPDM
ncbi:hypothetical protein QS713_02720 [Gleimia hominis]|uniref:NGG1p interacting factor NIF3 n=1 Tax=Gleimia hominis TaxID=595468 RepID=A0ABU3I9C6_9ACTO|nr:hypothetical protein [Gleimia hominis]MDT3766978.1 hypothetical protein [Gleimia hominis]